MVVPFASRATPQTVRKVLSRRVAHQSRPRGVRLPGIVATATTGVAFLAIIAIGRATRLMVGYSEVPLVCLSSSIADQMQFIGYV